MKSFRSINNHCKTIRTRENQLKTLRPPETAYAHKRKHMRTTDKWWEQLGTSMTTDIIAGKTNGKLVWMSAWEQMGIANCTNHWVAGVTSKHWNSLEQFSNVTARSIGKQCKKQFAENNKSSAWEQTGTSGNWKLISDIYVLHCLLQIKNSRFSIKNRYETKEK